MKITDELIPAIDILLLIVIMLLTGMLAVRYDANKGVGGQSFVVVVPIEQRTINPQDIQTLPSFFAIEVEKSSVRMYQIKGGKKEGADQTIKLTDLENVLDPETDYVIYEKTRSGVLDEIVRIFVRKKIPFGIAQVAR